MTECILLEIYVLRAMEYAGHWLPLTVSPDLNKLWEPGCQAHLVAARHQQAQFEINFDITLITKNIFEFENFIWCWVQILILEFINLILFSFGFNNKATLVCNCTLQVPESSLLSR